MPTSIYVGRGKFVLLCHGGLLAAHCYPVLPSALNVHGTVWTRADVRSTWVWRRDSVIYPRWLGANLLVTFLPKLQQISWLYWKDSRCKCEDNTGRWSTWREKKWSLLKVPCSHFNNLRKTYSCSRVTLKKGRGPTFTEPQLWTRKGTRIQKGQAFPPYATAFSQSRWREELYKNPHPSFISWSR